MEEYYFIKFEHKGKDYLLYDEHSQTFPATTTLELAKDLAQRYNWSTELAVDFVPVKMTIEKARDVTGIPFRIIDFFAGIHFNGVLFKKSKRKEEACH